MISWTKTIENYNTADGDSASGNPSSTASIAWGNVLNTPTTLVGYGLSGDAYTKAESNANFSALGHTHTFASITSKPTTLAGYGITNAYTKTESDTNYEPKDAAIVKSDEAETITALWSHDIAGGGELLRLRYETGEEGFLRGIKNAVNHWLFGADSTGTDRVTIWNYKNAEIRFGVNNGLALTINANKTIDAESTITATDFIIA